MAISVQAMKGTEGMKIVRLRGFLAGLEAELEEAPLPDEIQALIQQYSSLVQPIPGLPPKRDGDHSIPLLPGAAPFRLRPYRYNPCQKDEIEKQIKEMLEKGLFRHSASPFSSPALLVKKKTGDWRLYVDYRRLNAMTIKNKYPLPIIDELLDELNGASWFSSLDLCSGFHQIRMAEGDEYKTAFQTHNGHYEYQVMPYGVTGGASNILGDHELCIGSFLEKICCSVHR